MEPAQKSSGESKEKSNVLLMVLVVLLVFGFILFASVIGYLFYLINQKDKTINNLRREGELVVTDDELSLEEDINSDNESLVDEIEHLEISKISSSNVINDLQNYYVDHNAEIGNGFVIESLSNDDMWWKSTEGYMVKVSNADYFEAFINSPEEKWGYDYLPVEGLLELFSREMIYNGYQKDMDNTTNCATDLSCSLAYVKDENRCKAYMYNEGYAGEDTTTFTIKFYCSDDYEFDYDNQISYLKALDEAGVTMGNCGIDDFGNSDDYSWYSLKCGLTGLQVITKWNDDYSAEIIWDGQGYYPCDLKDEYSGVEGVVHYTECED